MENKKILKLAVLVLVLAGCYKEPVILQNQVILSMSGNHTSLPADGVSKQMITVELPDKTTDATNSVVFNTTKGLFDVAGKNTITVSAQNTNISGQIHKIATVYLISSADEGIAYVTATIKNYTQTDTITISRAYPDIIHVNVDKLNYQLSNTGEVTITVQTKRNPGTGTPSVGQPITLSALDSTKKVIGSFRNLNLLTDATGNCVNYFSLPIGATYTGKILISAGIQSDPTGKTINDAATINAFK